jgi:hypothetical protein
VRAAVDSVLETIGEKTPEAKQFLSDIAQRFDIRDSETLGKVYTYLKDHAGQGAAGLAGLTAILGGGAYAHGRMNQAVERAMMMAGGLGLAGGLAGGLGAGALSSGQDSDYYSGARPGRYASDHSTHKENLFMNFHTKMAAAASYELGVKVANAAMEQLVLPGVNLDPSTPVDLAEQAATALRKKKYEGHMQWLNDSLTNLQNKARLGAKITGGVGLGLGAAAGGHHLYKQHQREKLLKRLAMGGGAAALLGGGGLAAHHLLSDDDE